MSRYLPINLPCLIRLFCRGENWHHGKAAKAPEVPEQDAKGRSRRQVHDHLDFVVPNGAWLSKTWEI